MDDVNPYYFVIHSISLLVQSCSINPCVYATYDTEQYYAKCTQSESQLSLWLRNELSNRLLTWLDIHSLNNEKIVVEAYHGVYQSDEHYNIGNDTHCGVDGIIVEGRHEDEELREHTSKWRNTTK